MDALVQERLAQLQREAEEEVAAQERDEQALLARRRGVFCCGARTSGTFASAAGARAAYSEQHNSVYGV